MGLGMSYLSHSQKVQKYAKKMKFLDKYFDLEEHLVSRR